MKKLKPDKQLIVEIKEKIGDEAFQRNFGKGAEEILNELIQRSTITFEEELEKTIKEVLHKYPLICFERTIVDEISNLNCAWKRKDLVSKVVRFNDYSFVVVVSYKDNKEDEAKIFVKILNVAAKETWK